MQLRHDIGGHEKVINRGDETVPDQTRSFLHKCPNGECKGYLSAAWKCGICNKYTCPECNEVKEDSRDAEHAMQTRKRPSNAVDKKRCRNCCGCGTLFTEFTDAIKCGAHTAIRLSWRTGLPIISGAILNPHFYQWQQEKWKWATESKGMHNVASPHHRLSSRLVHFKNDTQNCRALMHIHRMILHTEHVEIVRYPVEHNERQNTDLRVKYLMNGISEEEWKRELQKREKSRMKKRNSVCFCACS